LYSILITGAQKNGQQVGNLTSDQPINVESIACSTVQQKWCRAHRYVFSANIQTVSELFDKAAQDL